MNIKLISKHHLYSEKQSSAEELAPADYALVLYESSHEARGIANREGQ
jgi:hypothetical protein